MKSSATKFLLSPIGVALSFCLKIIIFTIISLVCWNSFTDWYLSRIQKPIAIYQLQLESYSSDKKILQDISEQLFDDLKSQIVIASPQRISPTAILNIYFDLPRKAVTWSNHFKLNLDLVNYWLRKNKNKTPYGGFIFFDYNVGNYTLDQYKTYTEYLKKIYRIEIHVSFKRESDEPVYLTIYPWLVADCDVKLTKIPYCRNFAAREQLKNRSLELLYSQLGLNSPLSPSVDKLKIEENCSKDNPIIQDVVRKMYFFRQLPVLKHFLYDFRIDTHLGAYKDNRSLNDIKRDTACYRITDKLGIPFGIMPSHFYLNAIDPNNVLTRSDKFQAYVERNFPNAYTISDEISMQGYSSDEDFEERIIKNSSDILLVHGGTFKFWKRMQIQNGIKRLKGYKVKKKIFRNLELKKYYGLLKIERNN